jgi:hypothetical protein
MPLALAEKAPQQLKTAVDALVQGEGSTPEFVVKTLFLYFLELMGVSDHADLSWFCQMVAKTTDEKKLKAVFADDFRVQFDKMVFFSSDKKAGVHLKLFKKVCKFYVGDVVDLLPDHAEVLKAVVDRVVGLSSSSHRLVRYTFTVVALQLYKCLLLQQKDLGSLRKQLEAKRLNEIKLKQDDSLTSAQVKAITEAHDLVKTAVLQLQTRVVL